MIECRTVLTLIACASCCHTQVDLATLDLSFISVLKVLPAVVSVMHGSSECSGTAAEQPVSAEQQGTFTSSPHGDGARIGMSDSSSRSISDSERTEERASSGEQASTSDSSLHIEHMQHQQAHIDGQQSTAESSSTHKPAQLIVLIKPQFEAGRAEVCSGGVVRDPKVCGPVFAYSYIHAV